MPPSSAEALAPAAATSSSVPASTEALDLADDSSAAPASTEALDLADASPATGVPPPADLVELPPAPAALTPSTSAVAAPIILKPESAEESLPDPASGPVSEPGPEPVSLPEVGAIPEPAEAVVTAAPNDHEHPEPAPEPERVSLLPPPVGEPILLSENTEETFRGGSGAIDRRYQPIEIEVGTQFRAPDWEDTSIITRPPVDLNHNGLWDIYRCSIHESYGTENGWEFVQKAYRDDDGRFRLVIDTDHPVGPC